MAKKNKKTKKSGVKAPFRKFGTYKGQIVISDDFNAPLPDEILDAFEGKLDSEDEELNEEREEAPLAKKSGPPKKAGPTRA